ncbi:MAG: nitrous oxide reductase family maturation protein NosD [Geminicoccaceae bacterium]|nr:nitrous oxide reductase family maturation protein NosD [Geminicoccaceae bacterium]
MMFGRILTLMLLISGIEAEAAELMARITDAPAGAVIDLDGRSLAGPIIIDRPLTLRNGRIEGDGTGSVVTIAATDVILENLEITGSGLSLESMDAGVRITADGDRGVIRDSRILNNLIGVHLEGPNDALVENNLIEGRRDLRMNERGNGVYVWNTPGSVVAGNTIRHGRDGIFANTSRKNIFRGNRFENLRFAVHYMYTNKSTVAGNVSIGNHIGFALMYSKFVEVLNNRSIGDRDHGIMLNYTNSSTILGNIVEGSSTADGPEKCVFIYNSNKNSFSHNRFAGCDIGVHFTAGSERNEIWANAFIGNAHQVKYVGSRWLDWSKDGTGNYWSDNAGIDLDGDGRADQPYRPNDLVDHLVWRQPLAALLLNSPAVQLLRWAQSRFPGLMPGGVIDRHPLMNAAAAGGPA